MKVFLISSVSLLSLNAFSQEYLYKEVCVKDKISGESVCVIIENGEQIYLSAFTDEKYSEIEYEVSKFSPVQVVSQRDYNNLSVVAKKTEKEIISNFDENFAFSIDAATAIGVGYEITKPIVEAVCSELNKEIDREKTIAELQRRECHNSCHGGGTGNSEGGGGGGNTGGGKHRSME
jgi:hypothetical protein